MCLPKEAEKSGVGGAMLLERNLCSSIESTAHMHTRFIAFYQACHSRFVCLLLDDVAQFVCAAQQ